MRRNWKSHALIVGGVDGEWIFIQVWRAGHEGMMVCMACGCRISPIRGESDAIIIVNAGSDCRSERVLVDERGTIIIVRMGCSYT